MFPDLWEEGHGKTEPEYARLDLSLFDKYRTEMNNMAKVVQTQAGGYLSMSNNFSMRRLCYMHQLTVIKPCEIPQCTRWLFPQTHPEAELIGMVHWISGEFTQMLTQDLKVRLSGILYACKFCLVRSQSTDRARQLLKDLKQDVVDKRARDAAARRVKGIAKVPAINVTNEKAPVTKVETDSWDNDKIRSRPKACKKPGSRITTASIKRSLINSYPSLSVQDASDDVYDTANKTVTNRPGNTNKELLKLFDDDSQCLARSITKLKRASDR